MPSHVTETEDTTTDKMVPVSAPEPETKPIQVVVVLGLVAGCSRDESVWRGRSEQLGHGLTF